jgi:hypothetical protein
LYLLDKRTFVFFKKSLQKARLYLFMLREIAKKMILEPIFFQIKFQGLPKVQHRCYDEHEQPPQWSVLEFSGTQRMIFETTKFKTKTKHVHREAP